MRALLDRVQPWHAGLLAGVVVALAVGGYLWLDGQSSDGRTADAPPAVKRGLACPHLSEAFAHSQAGDAEALRRSVAAAARAGEKALDTSGQEFGRPEEIAIELEYVVSNEEGGAAGVSRLLTDARQVCSRLGRWQPAS